MKIDTSKLNIAEATLLLVCLRGSEGTPPPTTKTLPYFVLDHAIESVRNEEEETHDQRSSDKLRALLAKLLEMRDGPYDSPQGTAN